MWILLLLVLLISCRLIMTFLSDPVPQRVPPWWSTGARLRKVTLRFQTSGLISNVGADFMWRCLRVSERPSDQFALSAYPNVAGCRPFGCFIRRVADLD